MSDIFREVDEDLRREQAKTIWKRYGNLIIAGAVLVVVLVAGYRFWEYWQARQAAATGDRFTAAVQLAAEGKNAEADAAFAAIIADGTGEYPVLARMRAATAKAAAGNTTAAAADFDAIAADAGTSPELKTVARLRAALILVDTASFADLKGRIEDLSQIGLPYRSTAREILGLSAFRAGEFAEAKRYFEEIDVDPDSPSAVKGRAQLMLDLVRARLGDPAKPADGES